jgi:hypothetical protein
MKRVVCTVVLALLLVGAPDALAGGRGGRGRGGHYGRSWGTQHPVVWSTQVGGWTVYRVGGGVVPSAPLPPPSTYWLYCRESDSHYPYVRDCSGGWLQVEPAPAGGTR